MNQITLLHIYGQSLQHDAAYIVGNRQGLEALKEAIETALTMDEAEISATVADGEGYQIYVLADDNDWQGKSWQGRMLPYSHPIANRNGGGKKPPWHDLKIHSEERKEDI